MYEHFNSRPNSRPNSYPNDRYNDRYDARLNDRPNDCYDGHPTSRYRDHFDGHSDGQGRTHISNSQHMTHPVSRSDYRQDVHPMPYPMPHPAHHSAHHHTENSSDIHPKRMEVWYAGLDRMAGSFVQGGNRPVLIVSNDVNNSVSPLVTVIPMTSKPKKMYIPTHVWVDSSQMGSADIGVDVASGMMLAEQITTIDKRRLMYRMCEVKDAEAIKRIEHSVNVQLGVADR